jgi:Copper type II ascorbate-dependent monooxygenase, C-terminal domain
MRSLHGVALLPLFVGCALEAEGPHVNFRSEMYTLQPGEEKYFCYTTNLPTDRDIAITKMTPSYGIATHHILFSQAAVPEPAGVSECNVLSKATWVPMYAGGKDSGPLALPENTGFRPLARGQQVVMQLHVQNVTDAPLTERSAMRIDYVDATPDVMQAGLFGIDNHKLTIPPHSEAALTEMNCVVDRDLDVFAVLGHMHRHGVHLDLSRGPVAGTEMLYEEKWNFDTQPVTPISFKVSKDDNLHLRCTHRNSGDAPIEYGESSDTEMCSIVMYYAPSAGSSGCTRR